MTDGRSAVAHAMLAWSLRTYFHGRAATASVQRDAIPWDGLLWFARQHDVQPLVYHSLTTYWAGMMPLSLQQQRHALYQVNGFESLRQMGEVLTLLEHLHTHQVQAIPLCGGLLAQLTYGHMALRVSRARTLRFILHEADIRTARQLLSTLGYDARGLSRTSIPSRLQSYVDTTGQAGRRDGGRGLPARRGICRAFSNVTDASAIRHTRDVTWLLFSAVSPGYGGDLAVRSYQRGASLPLAGDRDP